MTAYYNEIDKYAAAWLRNLIAAGHIAPGDVDERSIEDVKPSDLAGYTQCHFFAGIGVWSHSLRLAGWPDDRPVWTGSCPCQPFSAAGKRGGAADERHLWPAWSWLIRECKPRVVFGEQVASKDGRNWLDLVQTDLEAMGFAVGAGDICAAGVGAPHIRQRLYFVADADSERRVGLDSLLQRISPRRLAQDRIEIAGCGEVGELADADERTGRQRCAKQSGSDHRGHAIKGAGPSGSGGARVVGDPNDTGSQGRGVPSAIGGGHRASERVAGATGSPDWLLADPDGGQPGDGDVQRSGEHGQQSEDGGAGSGIVGDSGCTERGAQSQGWCNDQHGANTGRQETTSGQSVDRTHDSFWLPCDWLPCIDGKARPVEPVAQQMVDGSAESLGYLRPAAIEEVEKEIADACERETDPREALRDVWLALLPEAISRWNLGRFYGVHEAPFLLAYLRQLQDQGWRFSQSVSRTGSETSEAFLRVLRGGEPVTRTPCRRELEEQLSFEHSNFVYLLSSILARHATAAWGEVFDANAKAVFPLIRNAPSRVGRLRAYGNAIVAPLAKEFISAYVAVRESV